MTQTDQSLAGALLDGRYQIQRLLARGGMSTVYQGVDTRLQRPVAIKVMDPRFVDDRTFLDRFEREARAAAALDHPNVIAVHDQGMDNDVGQDGEEHVFLVMELVDGATLRQLLDEQGPLDVHVALSVLEPVLSALAAAHGAGLVHRDVKPENVLIGRGVHGSSEIVKIGDFGLVRAVASTNSTSSSVILGTVAYLSPEQVTTGAASERGDVYSAGILLYEMLTGAPPYSGDTALSVAYRHVNDDVPAPSTVRAGIPPGLDELVLRATRRAQQDRPADAAEFLSEVRRLRAELGIELVDVPVPQSATPSEPAAPETGSERTVPGMQAVTAAVDMNNPAGPRGTRAIQREAPPTGRPQPETPDPDDEERGRWWLSRRWLALWVVIGLVLVGGIGTTWWLNSRWIQVPDVVGMSQTEASRTLRQAHLFADFIRKYHNTVPEGTVIRTTPDVGSRALPGDTVTVVLSAGNPVVPEIPPGTSPIKAERLIRQAQLTPKRDPNANRYSTKVPAGAVITVRPKPGTELSIGDPVTLVISKGPPPTPVPELTGRTKKAAFEILRNKGFEPFVADKKFSKKVAHGHVIKTKPRAGTRGGVNGTMRVGVYLSTAVKVPSVVGDTIEDAVKTLREAGFRVRIDGFLIPGDGGDGGRDEGNRFGYVVNQKPDAGSFVKKGSTIKLKTVP